jgi:hypothetical protein
LLFLATCSGDGELALGVARRLSAEDPPFRPAVYGEVAIQVARGRRDLAMARADAWLRDHAGDADMRARAERNLDPVSWQRGPVRARSPEEGLDFAAGLLATTH